MNKRSAIFSETEFYSRDRTRDPDLFRRKREKTLEELEKESEDKLISLLYSMKTLYNQKESSTKSDSQTTDFIIELLKELILSERQELSVFREIKRQKRRNSCDLILDISVNQCIDSLNISMQQHVPKVNSLITFKCNSEQTTNEDECSLISRNKHDNSINYFIHHKMNQSLAQNIFPQDKIRIMFVSNCNDVITRSLIGYFIYNNDSFHDSCNFTIKHKLYQLTNKKTVSLSLYDTEMPFHSDLTSRTYYYFIDICIYFINNFQPTEDTFNEVKVIFNNLSATNHSTTLVIISNNETSIELKEQIQLISQSLTQLSVDSSSEFNRIVLHKLITNFLLRKALISQPSSEEEEDYDDDLYAISDDLNCGSTYSMEGNDDDDEKPDSISKFGRSKSIR